jgi:hypothetical protein
MGGKGERAGIRVAGCEGVGIGRGEGWAWEGDGKGGGWRISCWICGNEALFIVHLYECKSYMHRCNENTGSPDRSYPPSQLGICLSMSSSQTLRLLLPPLLLKPILNPTLPTRRMHLPSVLSSNIMRVSTAISDAYGASIS